MSSQLAQQVHTAKHSTLDISFAQHYADTNMSYRNIFADATLDIRTCSRSSTTYPELIFE